MKNNAKILVFPKDKNPYQELLYSPLREKRIKIEYAFPRYSSQVLSLLFLIPSLFYHKLKGYRLFHLHWTGGFSSPNRFLRIPYSVYFLFMLRYLKILNYRIVWTVHNILPHEKQFFNDLACRKVLSAFADAKIAHSSSTIEEMKKLKMNTADTFVIPIGSYAGIYENRVSKEKARKCLGLNRNDFIFLFFGGIKGYKGLDDLLPAFYELTKKEKNARLVIAGTCNDSKLTYLIKKYEKILGRNLIFKPGFVEDGKVQHYFNSSDVAVFPFKKVTTSSSAILALAFARPIIVPEMGCLEELPSDAGFFYSPNEKNALYDAMRSAIKNKANLRVMEKKALDYAKSLSWDKIAEKTYEVYSSLIE